MVLQCLELVPVPKENIKIKEISMSLDAKEFHPQMQ